ncbi:hypothetical protein [Hydrogenophaga sp.]|uniref:hypothetical protein n=1 Tax=Hydrogenophaga sp. TaxID=1904254 RepID=UPI0025BEC104|nr:hypothetical protein [Hydrogenophaga sp.]
MYRVAIISCVIGMLLACAGVSRFEKGVIVAHGERLEGASEVLYYLISIDLGQDDAADQEVVRVRLKLAADAPMLPLSALRPEVVAKYLPRFVAPSQWPASWRKKAEDDDAYAGGGFYLRFEKGRLVSVSICSHCSGGRESPVVGAAHGPSPFKLPLSISQLVEVFGSPDRLRSAREVTY